LLSALRISRFPDKFLARISVLDLRCLPTNSALFSRIPKTDVNVERRSLSDYSYCLFFRLTVPDRVVLSTPVRLIATVSIFRVRLSSRRLFTVASISRLTACCQTQTAVDLGTQPPAYSLQ
jgi:hypothetical protein